MDKLILEWQDKLSSILFEDKNVDGSEITDAINNQYRVLIKYDDETAKHQTGARLIEPYVYGLSKAGNEVIRAFQYYGATRRGVPKYKLFRVDRILSWEPKTNSKFVANPKMLNVTKIDYNENGDKSMTMVFDQVKFSHDNMQDTSINQQQEWESPLDRIKRQKEAQKKNIEQQINNQQNNQGAIETPTLKDELKGEKNSLENELDSRLGTTNNTNANPRGALKIGQDKWDADSLSPEERHDKEVMRRRDNRWKASADERPMWRKGSMNDALKQNEN